MCLRLQTAPEPPYGSASSYLRPFQPYRGLPAAPLSQPGQVAHHDLGWSSCGARCPKCPFQPQPGAALRGHASPGPARVKAAESRGLG